MRLLSFVIAGLTRNSELKSTNTINRISNFSALNPGSRIVMRYALCESRVII